MDPGYIKRNISGNSEEDLTNLILLLTDNEPAHICPDCYIIKP